MKEWLIYIYESKVYVTLLMEFLAALSGSLFLYFSEGKRNKYRLFVNFLWSVLIIDFVGGYAGLAYFDNYEHFEFLKGTPFVRNEWYFNIAQVYFRIFYIYFLREEISSSKLRRILKWGAISYVIFAVINMYLSEDFYENDVIINNIVGAFLILLAVFFYFFDLMMSDKVLSFYKNLIFYVAVGISISYLVRVPISIYNEYFTQGNPEFNQVFRSVVRYSNIFMYSMFIIGFFMHYRYRKTLVLYRG